MKLVGTITSAGATTNNSTTAVAFDLPEVFFVQCSKDCYVTQGSATSQAATSANFVYPQYAIIELRKEYGAYLAMLPVDGAAGTLKVGVK